MPVANPVIEIEGLDFAYNGEKVLEGVDLSIQPGDFVGLLGPNGSGKTTLLRLMLGLLKVQRGEIKLFGVPVGRFRDWSKIGYVPQHAGLLDVRFPLTAGEVVAMGRTSGARIFQRLGDADRKIISHSLSVVGLRGFEGRRLSELSGGQQQRVFIARALAAEPELLVLDEPTVGVDVEAQEQFYALLKELNRKMKLTLILVSHDVDVMTSEVTSVACLNRRLVFHGSPGDFIKHDHLGELYGKDAKVIEHHHGH